MMKHFYGANLLLLIAGTIFVAACQASFAPPPPQPQAHQALLDVTDWDFEKNGIIPVDGQWAFYWHQLLEPADFATSSLPAPIYVQVPNPWTRYTVSDQPLPGEGFATYRMTLQGLQPHELYGLKIIEIGTTYRLWVNGTERITTGVVGTSRETTSPSYLRQTIYLEPVDSTLTLTLQIANFHHRRGGIWQSIRFGLADQIEQNQTRGLAMDMFLFGSLLIMGLYHFGLYSSRRQDSYTMYFSVFCLLMALRTFLINENMFIRLQPQFDWTMALRLEYLTVYASVPIFAIFLRRLYPREFNRSIIRWIQYFGVCFSGWVILFPPWVFTRTLAVYQSFIVLVGLYAIICLIVAAVRGRDGARLFGCGFFILFAAVFNDILYANRLFGDIYAIPFGLLACIFLLSLVLSRRLSKEFHQTEQLSQALEVAHQELQGYNRTLETRVEQRTSDLQTVNHQLQAEIVERTQAQEEIAVFAQIVDHVGYALLNKEFTVVSSNMHFNQWLEGEPESIIDQDIREVLPELFGFEEELELLFSGAETNVVLAKIYRPSDHERGRYFTLDFELLSASRQFVLVLVNDVTADVHLEANWKQERNELRLNIIQREQAEAALKDSQKRLTATQRLANLGSWELDVATRKVTWSDETFRLVGLSAELFDPSFEKQLELLHPEDALLLADKVEKAIEEAKSHQIELRFKQPVYGYRYVVMRIEPISENNQVIKLLGSMLDITERKEYEQMIQQANTTLERRVDELSSLNLVSQTVASVLDLEAILEKVAQHLTTLFKARSTGIALFNQARTGLEVVAYATLSEEPSAVGAVIPLANNPSTQQVIKTHESVVVTQAQTNPLTEPIHHLMRERQTESLLIVPLLVRGEVIGTIGIDTDDVNNTFSPDQVTLSEMIASQIAGAIENARLFKQEQEERQFFETMLLNSPVATAILDVDYNVTSWNPVAENLFGYDQNEAIGVSIYDLVTSETNRHEAMAHGQQALSGHQSGGITRRYRRDGQPVDVEMYVVPITIEGEIAALLVLYHDITELQQARRDIEAANQQITQLNQKLQAENLRLEAEVDVTHRLQKMVLPTPKELEQISELDIAAYMEPADEVGGDYYDILQHNGRVRIGIGDVTGHGLESGVIMLMTQSMVRALLTSEYLDVPQTLNTFNQTLYDNIVRMNLDKNLTLTLLDYHQGQVTITGQHEELIVVRQNGMIELIDTFELGFPVGLESDISAYVDTATIALQPGDGFVLYTDGIIEATNCADEMYGLERLCDLIRHHWSQPAEAIKDHIIADVHQFIGSQTMYDDLTLVVVKQK